MVLDTPLTFTYRHAKRAVAVLPRVVARTLTGGRHASLCDTMSACGCHLGLGHVGHDRIDPVPKGFAPLALIRRVQVTRHLVAVGDGL